MSNGTMMAKVGDSHRGTVMTKAGGGNDDMMSYGGSTMVKNMGHGQFENVSQGTFMVKRDGPKPKTFDGFSSNDGSDDIERIETEWGESEGDIVRD